MQPPVQSPPAPYPQQPAGPHPYPIALQIKMRVHQGHLFLGHHALYFVSGGSGSALWGAAGQALGGAVGGLLTGIGTPGAAAAPGGPITEEALYQAAVSSGGMVFEPSRIGIIKQTIWMRGIKYDGSMIGAKYGFPKELRQALGVWGAQHGVATKGMK